MTSYEDSHGYPPVVPNQSSPSVPYSSPSPYYSHPPNTVPPAPPANLDQHTSRSQADRYRPSPASGTTHWGPYESLKRKHDELHHDEDDRRTKQHLTPLVYEAHEPPRLLGATQYLQRPESQNGSVPNPARIAANAPSGSEVPAHYKERTRSTRPDACQSTTAQPPKQLSMISESVVNITNNQPPRASQAPPKRPAQAYSPPRGTQHAPLEISSSPEPETECRETTNTPQTARPKLREASGPTGPMSYDGFSRQELTKMLAKSTNSKPSKVRYYAVAIGRKAGVYPDWPSAEKQVHGFFGARHKKFKTVDEALAYVEKYGELIDKAPTMQSSRSTAERSFDSGYHSNGTSSKTTLSGQSSLQRTKTLGLDADAITLDEQRKLAELYDLKPPEPEDYAVVVGRKPGVYNDWATAEEQIKGIRGAEHAMFKSPVDAWDYIEYTIGDDEELRRIFANEHKESPPRTVGDPQYLNSRLSPNKLYTSTLNSDGSSKPRLSHAEHQPSSTELDQEIGQDFAPPEVDVDPVLVPEQQQVVDLILQGHNVFYTGSAGCGKSTILKAFVKQLTKKKRRVKIIAPTNLAALNVGGQTTWNFAGWTPDSMKKSLDELMKGAQGKEVYKRLTSVDVLVIDEISMIENLQFERLNLLMKQARGNGAFGGVQIIVTGDFCQLSPVKPFQHCIGCGWELQRDNDRTPSEYRCEKKDCRKDVFYDVDKWAFRSKAWRECNFKYVNLTQIHRQSDMMFKSILNRIRTDGRILKPHAHALLHHTSETEGAIELYALRKDVDRVNNMNISKLPSVARSYKCADFFRWAEDHRDDRTMERNTFRMPDGTLAALKDHRFETQVQLKEGQRVVLQANIDPMGGLVNGAQGTIIDFEPYDKDKLPKAANGPNDDGDLRGDHATYREHQIKDFAKANGNQPWPVVKFLNGRVMTIMADCTANELGNEKPYSLLSRTQIPLAAGYAITVHKSQGMTLDRVIVDLARAFETSQIYVALSRARSLKGLTVKALPRNELGGANAQVKEFMETYLGTKKWSTQP